MREIKGQGEKRTEEIWSERRDEPRGFYRRARICCGSWRRAACTAMQISPGRPLAFYRINLRAIRRTTIFNGSPHTGLLCRRQRPALPGRAGLYLPAGMQGGRKRRCLAECTVAGTLGLWPFFRHCVLRASALDIVLGDLATFQSSNATSRLVDALLANRASAFALRNLFNGC